MINKENNTTEKDKFFKNLNNLLITSGVIATGIKAISTGIGTQIKQLRRETERQMIIHGLFFFGSIFALYGAVQIVTHYFDASLYTNVLIGGFLLITSLIFKALK